MDPKTDPRWEAFVASHPQGSIYHHPAWIEVLTREYGRPSLCLACLDVDGQVQGILPLIETRGVPLAGGGLAGRRLSSLPRTPVAGPLVRDDQAAAALLNTAIDWVHHHPGTRLQLRLASAACDGLVEGLTGDPWLPSYRLELPAQAASLRFGDARNHGRIKWALGAAARHGVVVRPAETRDDLARWYPLYLRTMQAHAAPTRSYRFFKAAWNLLRPRSLMQLLLAERTEGGRRELMAGSVFLMFGQTVFYAFNGCSDAGLRLRANDVIQWHAIHDACRAGFRRYDLGEVVESQTGLHEFKRKWGAETYRLYRYSYPSSVQADRAAIDSRAIAGRLIRTAWRHLPAPAAARLSDWLYGYF